MANLPLVCFDRQRAYLLILQRSLYVDSSVWSLPKDEFAGMSEGSFHQRYIGFRLQSADAYVRWKRLDDHMDITHSPMSNLFLLPELDHWFVKNMSTDIPV